jgi:hypothetical protein
MKNNDIYIALFTSIIHAVCNVIEAGQYIIDLFNMNNDIFDPSLKKLGIDLKSVRFLSAIAREFTGMYPELIAKFNLPKAIILVSIGYPSLHFPIAPQQIRDMDADELIRYLFDHGLLEHNCISIPYIKQLIATLAIQHPTDH